MCRCNSSRRTHPHPAHWRSPPSPAKRARVIGGTRGQMIGIGIAGCGGRMGRALVAEVAAADGVRLAGATARAAALQGQDAGALAGLDPLGVAIGQDAEALFAVSDVVIDFTSPETSLHHAGIAASTGKALVIGTT